VGKRETGIMLRGLTGPETCERGRVEVDSSRDRGVLEVVISRASAVVCVDSVL
jgi:hypothetical protein